MKIKSDVVPDASRRRTYGQYCALARALDRIGDRWILLIVRELMIGPRRYSDIRGALPGIASNLLATRLRELEAEGIVRKRAVPPPTPATLYELTEYGTGLEEVVFALTRWGGRWLGERGDDVFDPKWLVVALRALLAPIASVDVDAMWELDVEGEVIYVKVHNGRVETGLDRVGESQVAVECDAQTALGLMSGNLSLDEVETTGRGKVRGTAGARRTLERFVARD